MGHTVVAVEPSHENLRHLMAAAQKTPPFLDRITILHNAVSSRRQLVVTLTSNPDNQGGLWIEPIRDDMSLRRQPSVGDQYLPMRPVIRTILMDDLIPSLGTETKNVIIKVVIGG